MNVEQSVSSFMQYPTLYDLLMALKDNTMAALRVMLPGTITAVNGAKVSVQVGILQQDSAGVPFPYPLIQNCPIVTMQGGGIAAVFPVEVGDQCLVFFADRCLDAWKKSGTPSKLPNLRMHDINDGFALVGVNVPTALTFPLLNDGEGGIASAQAMVVIDKLTGLVSVRNATQNLFVSLSNLTTAFTDLVTALTALNVGIASESGVIPTAAAAATTANVALVAVQLEIAAVDAELAALLY